MEEDHYFQRAVFQLALATGYRAPQMAVITHHPSFSRLEEDRSALTLIPSPAFLAKNELADSLIIPLRVPSLLERVQYHLLCPVHTFEEFVRCTEGA